MPYIDPRDIENRTYQPLPLRGGLDLTTSKYNTVPGTLQDVLNYESSNQGYTRSQGLLFYDGTYDSAVEDMWYIPTTTGSGGESVLAGTTFTLGGEVTWGTSSTGTAVYWNTAASAIANGNNIIYSRDLTNPAWLEEGTVGAAYNAVGLDGAANTATTLTDNDAASVEAIYQDITVPDDSNTHVARFFIKKDTDETRFVEVKQRLSGGTVQVIGLHVNTKTGASVVSTSIGTTTSEVNSDGLWWEIIVSVANNSTGNTICKAKVSPAKATVIGTLDVAATGSVIVGNIELYLNYTVASVRGTSAVYTANTSVLGVLNIIGTSPASGDTITDTTSGATLALASTLVIPSSKLINATVADTISEYLAYINGTVNTGITGQSYVAGRTSHHGKIPGIGGITGGFQFHDDVYGVRDYYSVGFNNGDLEPGVDTIESLVGSKIVVEVSANSSVVAGTVAEVVFTKGDWSTGDAEGRFILTPVLAQDPVPWTIGIGVSQDSLILQNNVMYISLSNHVAAAINEPGVGANWTTFYNIHDITDLSLIADGDSIYDQYRSNHSGGAKIANALTANTKYRGGLWKATTAGWSPIDTGYTIQFKDGEIAPSVRDAPLFVSNILSSLKDDGYKDWGTLTSVGASPGTAWIFPTQAAPSDNLYASSAMTGSASTQYLQGVISTSSVPSSNVRVVGIELSVEAKDGLTKAVDYSITLSNTLSGASWYVSDNRARKIPLTLSDAQYVYGDSTDLWGIDEILAQDILDGNISVRIQYKNTDTSNPNQVDIDNVKVKVHYVPQAEHIYINDGSTDVSQADITAWQSTNGGYNWGNPTKPAGVMSLYNLTNPTAIGSGMSIYTGANKTGSLIATTNSTPIYNMLPSEQDMSDSNSMYRSVVANFFADAGSDAVYGVTGASNGYSYNGDFFSFIRTPLLNVADKPRHVEFYVNMLAFAYETGHVLLSTVGAPNDFSAAQGGTSWGFRDEVTGLQALPGATLAVLTQSTTGTLTGTDPSSLSQKNVQPTSGAEEYTLQQIIEPFFLDSYGISSLSATSKFGDFSFGRVSARISPWLKDRLQASPSTNIADRTPVAAISIRNKNQYRLYFNDGYILTATFFANKGIEFTWQHYDTTSLGTAYVPTFLDSTVLSSGKERAIMGTSDGSMWIIDGANGIQTGTGLTEMDAHITLNPVNMGRPESVTKYHHVVMQGQFYGWQQVKAWADTNYVFNATGTPHSTINIGASTDTTVVDSSNNLDSAYLPMLADGYSIKLQTSVDGSKPHTLQSLLLRASLKGTDRTSTEKAY